jgi:hypothetical protein
MSILLEDDRSSTIRNRISLLKYAKCGPAALLRRVGNNPGSMGSSNEECVRKSSIKETRVSFLFRSVEGVAEMTSLGLGLGSGTFKDSGRYGYVISTCLLCAGLTLHLSDRISWLLQPQISTSMARKIPSWLAFTLT